MFNRLGFVISLFTLFALGAASPPSKLVRLTIVNKSGLPVEISLTGQECECSYYFRVAEGTRQNPTEQSFSIVPDTYSSTLYYIELWDPVYGYYCSSSSKTIDAQHNVKVVVLECDFTPPPKSQEPPAIIKYGSTSQTSQSQASSSTTGSLSQSLTGRKILVGRSLHLQIE